ncbi:hypothetical protein Y032_0838g2607 [Ancylostoma ceylanicum]|nr:hypothetical protein Y032_0838g2607 [Ancylostoma ceylanicum]
MSVLKLRNPPPGLSISSTGREEAVVVGSVPYVDGVQLEATARCGALYLEKEAWSSSAIGRSRELTNHRGKIVMADAEAKERIAAANQRPKFSSWRTVMISILVIGSVAFTWAMATQFSKTALVIDPDHFYAPYSMMWFNTNFMLLCYPTFLLYEVISRRSWRKAHEDASSIFGRRGVHPFTLVVCVAPFLIFWIGANYTYSASLLYISASVATSISSCNAAMVYLLAILLLGDRFVPMKLLSVVFAVAGVAVISLDGQMRAVWQGILLSVASAASAALYKVLFKRLMGSANLGQVSLFMSCLGFLNLLCNWVPVLVLLLTDSEHIEIAYVPWAPVIGAALLSLLFNFLINFGIALLHPLVVSIGMLMGIPLNTVIDVLFRHVPATAIFIGGTALIISSFILIIIPYELICRRNADSESIERFDSHVTRMQTLPDHIQQVFRRMTDHGSIRERY